MGSYNSVQTQAFPEERSEPSLITKLAIQWMSGRCGVTGGDEPLYEQLTNLSKDDLRPFASAAAFKAREETIRGLARALKQSGLSVDPEGSIQDIIRDMTSQLPNPLKNGKTFTNVSDDQKAVCKIVAEALNKQFSPNAAKVEERFINVPLNDPVEVCRQVGEWGHSLALGSQAELADIVAAVRNTLSNMQIAQEVMKKSWNNYTNRVDTHADDLVREGTAKWEALYEKAQSEFKKQMDILGRILNVNLAPVEVELAVALRDEESGNALVQALKKDMLGTKDFGDGIAHSLSGIGLACTMAAMVNDALNKVGVPLTEYLQSSSFGEFSSTLDKAIEEKGPESNVEELVKMIKAANTLREAYDSRKKIDDMCRKGAGEDRGDEDTVPSGGAGDYTTEGGNAVGGEDTVPSGNAVGGEDKDKYLTALEIKMKREAMNKNLLTLDFVRRMNRHFRELLDVVREFGNRPRLFGPVIPIDDKAFALRDDLNNLGDIYSLAAGIERALISHHASASQREKKRKLVSALQQVSDRADAILETHNEARLRRFKEIIQALLKTIDMHSDIFARTHGSGEATGGDDLVPEIIDIAPDISKGLLTLKQAAEEFGNQLYLSRLHSSLKTAATDIDSFSDKYNELLGSSIAAYICTIKKTKKDAIDDTTKGVIGHSVWSDEMKTDITSWSNEMYKCKLDLYRAAQALDLYLRDFEQAIAKNPDDVRDIGKMLSETQTIARWYTEKTGDEIALAFEASASLLHDGTLHADKIHTLHFGEGTFEHYYKVVEAVKVPHADRPIPAGTGERANTTFGHPCAGLGFHVPGQTRNDIKERVKVARKHVESSFDNFQALKNLINAFFRIGDQFSGESLHSKNFMKPIELYKIMMKFLKCSSYAVYLPTDAGDKGAYRRYAGAVDYLIAPTVVNGESEADGAPPAGAPALVGYHPNTRYREIVNGKIRIPTPWWGTIGPAHVDGGAVGNPGEPVSLVTGSWYFPSTYANFEGLFKNEYKLFAYMIQAMAGKILTVVGVHDILEGRGGIICGVNPIRQIIGGAPTCGDLPDGKPDAAEMYFRLPRLLEAYREIFIDMFDKEKRRGSEMVALVPDFDGTFAKLIRIIFLHQGTAANVHYTDSELNEIVAEINRIHGEYTSKHGQDLATKKAAEDLVAEVNRRFGIVKGEDYDKYLTKSFVKRGEEEDTSAEINKTDVSILPGEGEWTTVRRTAPSDLMFGDVGKDCKDEDLEVSREKKGLAVVDFHKENEGRHYLLMKFRQKLDSMFKGYECVHLNHASYNLILKAARQDMRHAADCVKRLFLAKNLIKEITTAPPNEWKNMILQEVVLSGLNLLDIIRQMLTTLKTQAATLNLDKLTAAFVRHYAAANRPPLMEYAVTYGYDAFEAMRVVIAALVANDPDRALYINTVLPAFARAVLEDPGSRSALVGDPDNANIRRRRQAAVQAAIESVGGNIANPPWNGIHAAANTIDAAANLGGNADFGDNTHQSTYDAFLDVEFHNIFDDRKLDVAAVIARYLYPRPPLGVNTILGRSGMRLVAGARPEDSNAVVFRHLSIMTVAFTNAVAAMPPADQDTLRAMVNDDEATLLSILRSGDFARISRAVQTELSDLVRAVRYAFNCERMMIEYVEMLFALNSCGFVDVDISETPGTAPNVSFTKLMVAVQDLFAKVRTNWELIKPGYPRKLVEAIESGPSGSIANIDQDLIIRFILPKTTGASREATGLDDIARDISTAYHALTKSHHTLAIGIQANGALHYMAKATPNGVGNPAFDAARDIDNKTEFFGSAFSQLAFYDTFVGNVDKGGRIPGFESITSHDHAANYSDSFEKLVHIPVPNPQPGGAKTASLGVQLFEGELVPNTTLGVADSIREDSTLHRIDLFGENFVGLYGASPRYYNTRSLMMVCNQMIAHYINNFLDQGSGGRIYAGLIRNLAEGIAGYAVSNPFGMNGGYPDFTYGEGAGGNVGAARIARTYGHDRFGYRGDPQDTSILHQSICLILQRLMRDVNNNNAPIHTIETMSEIPMFMKESFRVNLPAYIRYFKNIADKAEFVRRFANSVDLRRRSQGTRLGAIEQTGALMGLIGAGVKAIPTVPTAVRGVNVGNFTHGTIVPIMRHTIEDIEPAAVATLSLEGIHSVHSKVRAVCVNVRNLALGVLNSVQDTLRELGDNPIYFQTSELGIQTFVDSMGNTVRPIMPISFVMAPLNDRFAIAHPPAHDPAVHPALYSGLFPGAQPGLNRFKYMYGTRQVLAGTSPVTMENVPGFDDIIAKYNANILGTEKSVSRDNASAYLTAFLALVRYAVCCKSFVSQLAQCVIYCGKPTEVPNLHVYALDAEVGDMITIVESTDQNRALNRISEKISTEFQPDTKKVIGGRHDEVVRNLVDLNIMPINIHAFTRSVPLANLYNFAFTWQQLAAQIYGITRDHVELPLTDAHYHGITAGDHDTYRAAGIGKPTVNAYVKLLVDPYSPLDNGSRIQVYGDETEPTGLVAPIQRIFRGDNSLGLGRPKFLSDQLFNKALFGSVYLKRSKVDEGGPLVGIGDVRGQRRWFSETHRIRTVLRFPADLTGDFIRTNIISGMARSPYTALDGALAAASAQLGQDSFAADNNDPGSAAAIAAVDADLDPAGGVNVLGALHTPQLADTIRAAITGVAAGAAGAAVTAATRAAVVDRLAKITALRAADGVALVTNNAAAADFVVGDIGTLRTNPGIIGLNTMLKHGLTVINNARPAGRHAHLFNLVQADIVAYFDDTWGVSRDALRNWYTIAHGTEVILNGPGPNSLASANILRKLAANYPIPTTESATRLVNGVMTYIKWDSDETVMKNIVEETVKIPHKDYLQQLGFHRFNTFYVRNLFFITNVVRTIRQKMNRDLTHSRNVMLSDHHSVAPGVTEYGFDPYTPNEVYTSYARNEHYLPRYTDEDRSWNP